MANEYLIKQELDSNTGLYAGMTDEEVVTELMTEDKDNWVAITAAQIFETIDRTEFASLSNSDQTRIDRILGLGGEIPTAPGGQARDELIDIFGGGSTTISNLASIANQQVSRASQLGLGRVLVGDVQRARAI